MVLHALQGELLVRATLQITTSPWRTWRAMEEIRFSMVLHALKGEFPLRGAVGLRGAFERPRPGGGGTGVAATGEPGIH